LGSTQHWLRRTLPVRARMEVSCLSARMRSHLEENKSKYDIKYKSKERSQPDADSKQVKSTYAAEREKREQGRGDVEDPKTGIVRDHEGHIRTSYLKEITSRFPVRNLLGKGTFGKVVEAFDRKYNEMVAIKVVRNVKRYREDAQYEIKVLEKVRHHELSSKLLKWFDFHGHICIVFERLGESLLNVIDEIDRGLDLRSVRSIARQLFKALAYYHNEAKFVHTDLKLENVLLANPNAKVDRNGHVDDPSIKIIDFGGATFDSERKSTIINTRQYRAPEVILEMGWSFPSDIWSVGCIVFEIITGELLFDTHADREHLHLMERRLDHFSPSFVSAIRDSHLRSQFIVTEGSTSTRKEDGNSKKRKLESGSGSETKRQGEEEPAAKRRKEDEHISSSGTNDRAHRNEDGNGKSVRVAWPKPGHTVEESVMKRVTSVKSIREELGGKKYDNVVDLMRKCLMFDPSQRLTAAEALEHPFFSEE